MSRPPRVSVVLPAYDCEETIEEAVRSMLDQTFDDLEVIVIDDASTDRTVERVRAIDDARVRLLRQERNAGMAAALNRGIEESHGALVARMDGDDLSRPERIARQVAYLDAHPDVGMLGTRALKTRPGRRSKLMVPLLPPACLRARCLLDWGLHHPTIVMRRAVMDRLDDWYDTSFDRVQDRDFWLRMAMLAGVAMLPDPLLIYRGRSDDESRRVGDRNLPFLRQSARKRIEIFLGDVTDEERCAAEAIGVPSDRERGTVPLADVQALAERIVAHAREIDFAPPPAMASSLADLMFARYRRDRDRAWFDAVRELMRRHEVPRRWMPHATWRRWAEARLRTLV